MSEPTFKLTIDPNFKIQEVDKVELPESSESEIYRQIIERDGETFILELRISWGKFGIDRKYLPKITGIFMRSIDLNKVD
jgi:hypothetical protein